MQPATLKRGRGFSAVRALGYAILLSARPALFIAVLVFGWLFSGWPETWREVLRPPSVPEADAAAPAGQWWSMSYPFREKITVTAGTAAPPHGYSVALTLSHATIDTSKWLVTRGTTSVSGGILTVNPASSIWAQPTYAFGTDTRWEASIQLGGDGAELSFNFHAARDLDTNPWTGNWIILWSDATSHNAENSKASTLTDSGGFTDTTPTLFHTYVMNREGTTGVRYFQDATQRALLTTNVPTVSLRPYAFADAGTGATMWQKYDWWKVRQYVTPEPTSAIAAEEGVGPAYQAAGTIQFNTSTT